MGTDACDSQGGAARKGKLPEEPRCPPVTEEFDGEEKEQTLGTGFL